MTTLEWAQELALEGWRFTGRDGKLQYRAPQDLATPERLAALRERRDEILAILASDPDRLSLAPLSYGQRALWFLWMLSPDSQAYHVSLPLAVPSGGVEAAWRSAAERLIARHPTLRTRFQRHQGHPVQQILAAPPIDWQRTDARSMAETDVRRALAAAHARPFDLCEAPPVHFHWFDRAEAPLLLVTLHHIVCDAWSLELMRRELAADAMGHARLEPPAHTYEDFVRWQRSMLASPRGAALWDYWRDRLAEPRAALDVPTDRPRPAVQTFRGESVPVDLSGDVGRFVQSLASTDGTSRHMVLLAAFAALLYRSSRQRDLLIGIPAAGRSQPEFAGVIGYFVEPFVLRLEVSEGMTFRALVREVAARHREAFAHAEYPFALLVERLKLVRDPSRSPIFDVTFNFLSRRAAARAAASGDPAPAIVDLPQADGKFDLTLTVDEGDTGAVRAALGFNVALFDRRTASGLATCLRELIESACLDPDTALDELALTKNDRAPVLRGRSRPVDALRPIHAAIASAAAAAPDRVAVVAADGAITYGELMQKSGRLAEQLSAAGVGRDVPVGLCAARSTATLVGLLGILRAGGAYVPIEPSVPVRVRAQMLAQAGASIWLDEPEISRLASGDGATLVGAPAAASLDDLAYVIFTSGSTGAPKAVGVTHLALSNYVASIVEDLGIEPASSHALVSTLAADLGHTVLFPSLVTGGTLHVMASETATQRPAFASYLRDHGIDYLKIVPSHLAALADGRDAVLPRKALILGGESSSTEWVAAMQRVAPGCRIFNHYGPTETTVGVMTFAFDPDRAPASAALPLDRPVANSAIWILDRAGRPVPSGIPGELYVSGACVARGYLGDAVRTGERFVRAPDGSRAYRTGDLARADGDGRVLLLGRADRQVKVRGYRVEPTHIERVLSEHPGVRHAVVRPDVPEGGTAATSLTAFIVPAGPDAAAGLVGDLRSWLAGRVAPYLVPDRFVTIPEVPLTANGKLDERALLGIAPTVTGDHARRALPRDLVELRLQRIWREILGVSSVHPTDDFFDLGGHSLLAVRLGGAIFDEFGVHLPLARLFTHRTLERLAELLRDEAPASAELLVPLQPGPGDPLVCFPGAGGSLLYFQDLLNAVGPDLAVWGAQAPGLVDPHAPADVSGLASLYAQAIAAAFGPDSSASLIGHSFGALVAFETARLLQLRNITVGWIGIVDNPAPGLDGSALDDDDRDWLLHIATRIERLYGVDLNLDADAAAKAPRDAAWLLDRLTAAGVLPAGTRMDYFGRWIELYRANARAAASYRPPARASFPLTVFKARDVDARLGRAIVEDDALGWSAMTSGTVNVVEVPGTHITMLTGSNVRAIADALTAGAAGRLRSGPQDVTS